MNNSDRFLGFALAAVCIFLKMFCYADDVALDLNGLALIPFTEANLKVHRPYDLPLESRYSFTDGIRRLWVYAKDKPFKINSPTLPRTEIFFKNNIGYSSGVRCFQGYGFVPNGTSGATILQIFSATRRKSTFMLKVYLGNLMYYNRDVVATQIYDKWFRLNVIHDANKRLIATFIDGVKKYSTKDKGPSSKFYFKFGVYAQANHTDRMESRWKDIKIYETRNATLSLPP